MDQAIPAGAKRLLIAGLVGVVALLAAIGAYGLANADAAETTCGLSASSYESVQSETPEATPPSGEWPGHDCPKGADTVRVRCDDDSDAVAASVMTSILCRGPSRLRNRHPAGAAPTITS